MGAFSGSSSASMVPSEVSMETTGFLAASWPLAPVTSAPASVAPPAATNVRRLSIDLLLELGGLDHDVLVGHVPRRRIHCVSCGIEELKRLGSRRNILDLVD